MKASDDEMLEQAEFCKKLMSRLLYDMQISGYIKTSVVKDDVRRLRRELMVLSHMCEWEYCYKRKALMQGDTNGI